jgi:predicted DCC family thiol-disulfide oxidoreductase YuxK
MTAPLPTPTDRPDADVVLYDGRCGFCRARVNQLQWLDGGGGRLAYLSLHDPEVAQRYPDVSPERLLEEMCVVDRRGRRHWGAGAVRYLSRRLPRLWWLAPLMHLPGVMLVARPVYGWVSRNRYLLGGKVEECPDGACSIHR